MIKMQIQQLGKSNFEEIFLTFKEIESNLENHLWLYPCKKEWLQSMLSEKNGKTLYGAFSDDNELVAIQGLSPTMKEIIDMLNLREQETIEQGATVILPKFRGKSLSLAVSRETIKIAKLNGYKNIVAKAHPDNIASRKLLLALGMQLKTTITIQTKYIRDVYLLEI
ncbi:MAG: GNAT family N-acetyltransferase [Prevotella sp.]|jgi:RimJ/RimL family protein N-acetyltransferase|nr:GNAT family N-acetyltransferase [Prevotella sp.]